MGEAGKVNRALLGDILDEAVPKALALIAQDNPALGLLLVLDEQTRVLVTAGARAAVASTFKSLGDRGLIDHNDFKIKED